MGRTVRYQHIPLFVLLLWFYSIPSFFQCVLVSVQKNNINILLDHTMVTFSLMSPFQKLQNIPLEPWTVKGVEVCLYPLLTRGYIDIVCWCNRS